MSKYKLIIALDIGKSTTKAIARLYKDGKEVKAITKLEHTRFSLVTGADILENEDIDVDSGSYLVEYEGKNYLVGAQATTDSVGSSKLNHIHKICGLTAITSYLEENVPCDVYIILASPLNQLMNKEYIAEYKSFFSKEDNSMISLKVNKKSYSFKTKDIIVKPEGSGILYTNKNEFIAPGQEKEVVLVDVGGMNAGFTLYINGKAKKNERFIEELGNSRLEEIMEEAIITNSGSPDVPSRTQITKAIRQGHLTKYGQIDKKSIKYISSAKSKFFNEILTSLKKHKISAENVEEIAFIGGTSQNIQEQIKTIPNAVYIEDSQWKAVEGLYIFALAKYKSLITGGN